MSQGGTSRIAEVIEKHEEDLLREWIQEQLGAITLRKDLISETDLREQSQEFLSVLVQTVKDGDVRDIRGPAWEKIRNLLANISRNRAKRSETSSCRSLTGSRGFCTGVRNASTAALLRNRFSGTLTSEKTTTPPQTAPELSRSGVPRASIQTPSGCC